MDKYNTLCSVGLFNASCSTTSFKTTAMVINGLFSSMTISIREANWKKKQDVNQSFLKDNREIEEAIHIPLDVLAVRCSLSLGGIFEKKNQNPV